LTDKKPKVTDKKIKSDGNMTKTDRGVFMIDAIAKFKQRFNRAPEVLSSAPGRLEILGNHTDYNEGLVLSCAVTQRADLALARAPGKTCRIYDARAKLEAVFDLDNIAAATPKDWSNYVKGVIVELAKRGREIGAFNACLASSVPLSAGMSSSAALEMAAALAFVEAFELKGLDFPELARVGQGVENNYLGLKSGLLDQFSSLYGKKDALILSDFRTVEVLKTIQMPEGYSFVVVNSMIKHNLVDSEYNTRRQDCESAATKLSQRLPGVRTLRDVSTHDLEDFSNLLTEREYRRAKHVCGECERVRDAEIALERNDISKFGELLTLSHASSHFNFENSTPELDLLVSFANASPLCLGARLSGGGFGGITIHLVANANVEEYSARIGEFFRAKTGVTPQIIVCAIGDGASVRRIDG